MAKAAAELGTTPGAVSQLVIKTEKQLGRQVFQRTPAGLRLTPFGDDLAQHLDAGFALIARGLASATDIQSQVLRVATTLSFAEKWLVPRLADFQASNPTIRVQVDSALGLADLNQSDVDIALRFGTGPWPGTKAEQLSDYRVFPVCSPGIARQLTVPGDLCRANIIRYENARERWEDWAQIAGLTAPLPDGLMFSEAALCFNAAVAGVGVALGWDILLADELRDGRLVRPFKEHVVADFSLWFVTARSRGNDPKVSAFKAWVKRQLKE